MTCLTGPFTPIINYPEVAILGISRSTYEPVMVEGADAVRFLHWVAERLEHPLLLGIK